MIHDLVFMTIGTVFGVILMLNRDARKESDMYLELDEQTRKDLAFYKNLSESLKEDLAYTKNQLRQAQGKK